MKLNQISDHIIEKHMVRCKKAQKDSFIDYLQSNLPPDLLQTSVFHDVDLRKIKT